MKNYDTTESPHRRKRVKKSTSFHPERRKGSPQLIFGSTIYVQLWRSFTDFRMTDYESFHTFGCFALLMVLTFLGSSWVMAQPPGASPKVPRTGFPAYPLKVSANRRYLV